MPDRRRHGRDEGRVPASVPPPPPALAARPARGALAALCARRGAPRAAPEPARPRARARASCRKPSPALPRAARCRSGGATIFARERARRRRAPTPRRAREVVLFADTFNTYFEPENLRAAVAVLTAGGYTVRAACRADGRALCCGRTYLATGMIDAARAEARRVLDALEPFVGRGVADRRPRAVVHSRAARRAQVALPRRRERGARARGADVRGVRGPRAGAGRWSRPSGASPYARALVHGHCHQKAFGAMPAVVAALKLVPGLTVDVVPSSCCGMAGSFGYRARASRRVAAHGGGSAAAGGPQRATDTVIVADGTSCRHQIHDGAQRDAQHVARVLAAAL